MANFVSVRHKVRDFSTWKSGYDTHLPKRVAAGLSEVHVLQNAHDSNEVFILFQAEDLSRAKAFTESADLRETMQQVGVIEKPDIHFLNG